MTARGVQRRVAARNSREVDIRVSGIKDKLTPGDGIFDSDLFFAHEVKTGKESEIVIEKIESEPIVDAWKSTFKKK